MNPWLITWETGVRHMKSPIAAILHRSTSPYTVINYMRLLYANYLASGHGLYPSEQMKFAQRKYPCKCRIGQFMRIFTEASPMLFARHVYNMKVSKDKEGFEILTYEHPVFDVEPKQDTPQSEINRMFNRKKKRPRKRMKMTFYARTGEIKMGKEIVD